MPSSATQHCHYLELFHLCSKTILGFPLSGRSLLPYRVFIHDSHHSHPQPHRVPQHLPQPILTSRSRRPRPFPSCHTPLPQTRHALLVGPSAAHGWARHPGSGSDQPPAALVSATGGLKPLQTRGLRRWSSSPQDGSKPPPQPSTHHLSTPLLANSPNPTSRRDLRSPGGAPLLSRRHAAPSSEGNRGVGGSGPSSSQC